jgi:hypothetical protein
MVLTKQPASSRIQLQRPLLVTKAYRISVAPKGILLVGKILWRRQFASSSLICIFCSVEQRPKATMVLLGTSIGSAGLGISIANDAAKRAERIKKE